MENEILQRLLEIFSGPSAAIGPGIAGFAAFLLMKYVKRAAAWIDRLNPWIQRIVVMVLGVGFAWFGQLIGAVLPAELALWDQGTVSTILTGAWAMLLHQFHKDVTSGGSDGG